MVKIFTPVRGFLAAVAVAALSQSAVAAPGGHMTTVYHGQQKTKAQAEARNKAKAVETADITADQRKDCKAAHKDEPQGEARTVGSTEPGKDGRDCIAPR